MWPEEAMSGKGPPEPDPGRAASGEAQEGAVSTSAHTSPRPQPTPRTLPELGEVPPRSFFQLFPLENERSIFLVVYVLGSVLARVCEGGRPQ